MTHSHLARQLQRTDSPGQPFNKNESQLDIRTTPVTHFTCITVDPTDYPWEAPLAASQHDNDYESDTVADDEENYQGGEDEHEERYDSSEAGEVVYEADEEDDEDEMMD